MTASLSFIMFPFRVANVVSAFRMSNASGQAIVVILLLGSVFAWSIMVTKFSELKTAFHNADRFIKAYKKARHPLALFLEGRSCPDGPLYAVYGDICGNLVHSARIAERDAALLMRDDGMTGRAFEDHQLRALRALSEQFLSERMLELERHMVILATAATAAPFLGLLGTVWGVMDAFGGLALSTTATLSVVAPGVSGALLTTVVGLVVALPSLIGYNILVGRIRKLTLLGERFVQELMSDIENCFLRK